MGIRDWDIVTSYVDSVTTILKTVTFPKVQEQVKVKNQGNANLTYTIGSQSGTLTPGQSVTVNEDISSFTIQSVSGVQAFELRAKEKGTEQTETETDVMTLLADRVTKVNPMRSPFNVVGNANFYKTADGKWYQDSSFTILANDDTSGIIAFLDYCKNNFPYDQILFPRKSYLITSTITIPVECRNIDFNFSNFNYKGITGSYCLSGGSSDGVTGGFVFADWRNLTVQCDPAQTKLCHGVDIRRLRNGSFTNITVYYADHGIEMNDSWGSSLYRCKAYNSNLGIITGRSANAVNISKADIEFCNIGIEIGNGRTNGNAFGINGLTIDNETLIQNCSIALQLHFIKETNIVNSYFENNSVTIDIPLLTSSDTVENFTFEKNNVDMGSGSNECLLKLWDSARRISLNIDKNTIIGIPTATLFNRNTGVVGNIGRMTFNDNTLLSISDFTKVFPDTWKIGVVKTNFLFAPTIDSNWTVIQPIRIQCLGNNQFEITGAVQRKTGTTSTLLIGAIPYYMGSDSYVVSSSPIFQTSNGSGGSVTKMARMEIPTFPKQVNIFTTDTTDLNTIFINARWNAR